ncbi:MAG: hydroxymethylbilane synthase [Candidatus Binataceae bacterium]|jgi:hydroxymethylbilane synthase
MAYRLRIGSRPSQLALVQANLIKQALEAGVNGLAAEIVAIATRGDKMTSASLARIGGKGLFIRELEQALADGRIDIAVHSLKDLPAILPKQFRIAAVPEREDARDALLANAINNPGTNDHARLPALKHRALVGTSSSRRHYELLRIRPDLEVVPLRGNVDTRLRRLAEGDFDAIVLALAGLRRLGKLGPIDGVSLHPLDDREFVPSGGQGALVIEALCGHAIGGSAEIESAVASLNDARSSAEVTAERALLATIGASCVSPVGVKGTVIGDQLALRALLFSADGSESLAADSVTRLTSESDGFAAIAQSAGEALGEQMIARGARAMIGQPDHGD